MAQKTNPLTSLPYLMDLHRRLNQRLKHYRKYSYPMKDVETVRRKIALTEMMRDAYLPEDDDQFLNMLQNGRD